MASGAVIAIQDMGAAGLTCSALEMGAKGDLGIELPQPLSAASDLLAALRPKIERATRSRVGASPWGVAAVLVNSTTTV